jgi:hypothetical protein
MNGFITPNMLKTLLSDVQVASTTRPPGLTTRASSAAARLRLRREHHAEGGDHRVELAIHERQLLGVGVPVVDGEPLLGRERTRVLEHLLGDIRARDADTGKRCAITREAQPVPVARSSTRSPVCGESRSTACSIASAMLRLISS